VVTFTQDEIGVNDVEEMLRLVDADTLAAGDAGQAKSASDYRRVAGGAATGCENTFGDQHTVDIVRARLRAHQHNRYAGFAHLFGAVRVENGFPAGSYRGGIDTFSEQSSLAGGLFLLLLVDARKMWLLAFDRSGDFQLVVL